MGVFLPLGLKLELGPLLSNLGGCAVCTLGDGTGTSGEIMLGTEGDMWTLWWKLVAPFPSSSSMKLGCTEGRSLVRSGYNFWGTMADFSLFTVVKGLLFSSHYLPPCKISGIVDQLRLFGSRRCWKMALGVLGSPRHGIIHAPQCWGIVVGEWSIMWENSTQSDSCYPLVLVI